MQLLTNVTHFCFYAKNRSLRTAKPFVCCCDIQNVMVAWFIKRLSLIAKWLHLHINLLELERRHILFTICAYFKNSLIRPYLCQGTSDISSPIGTSVFETVAASIKKLKYASHAHIQVTTVRSITCSANLRPQKRTAVAGYKTSALFRCSF